MALNALKIQTADLVGKLVAQLSNRPTNPLSSGGDNLTAQEVKERYDAYGHLLKERFNALVDALVADPAVDTDALANTIQVYLGDPAEEDPMSLSDALAALFATLATKYALPEGGIPAADLAPAVTNAINAKYVKPGTGIPATDLETAVQTSLGKADTAYQKPSGGIPATDLASAVKAILDSAVSQSEFAPVKALAEGADQARAFENYSALVYNLVNTNAVSLSAFKVGQKIFVKTANVPDVWIYAINDTPVMYTYTTDAAFEAALVAGTLQVGYFTLAPVEGKTNLTGYATETYVGNAIAGNIDTDLDTAGKSADAKAVGDAIDALIDGLVEGIITVAEAEYANASTYSQQAAHAEIADEASSLSTSLGVTDETPTAMQPVGGTSDVTTTYQKLNKLVGCKVVKNQLVQNGNFANTDNWTAVGGTFSVANNIGTLTVTDPAKWFLCRVRQNKTPVVGHKYFLWAFLRSSSATQCGIHFDSTLWITPSANTWTLCTGVITAIGSAQNEIQYGYEGLPSLGDTLDCRNFIIHDLTLRYGNNDVVNAIIGNDSSKYVEKLLAFDPNILVDTAYDTGSFSMCKSATLRTVNYNQWDEVWETGTLDDNGNNYPSTGTIRSKNYIPVLPNREYGFSRTGYKVIFFYDESKQKIDSLVGSTTTFTTPKNCRYIRFRMSDPNYGPTYNHDICIFLYWDGSRIGYEPYSAHDYTLPNKDLNGILTVKNGKVIADGDELYPSGEGNATRYAEVDLGTLQFSRVDTNVFYRAKDAFIAPNAGKICTEYTSIPSTSIAQAEDRTIQIRSTEIYIKDTRYDTEEAFNAALSGVKLIYELATPTALTAPTFTSTFYGDDFGTMWFLDEDGNVINGLQGNEIFYKANVAGFAESLYSEAEGDPDYFEAAGDVPTDIANFLKGLMGYDASKTQTLKNVTGTLTWVDDV